MRDMVKTAEAKVMERVSSGEGMGQPKLTAQLLQEFKAHLSDASNSHLPL
jgi:hypothetical protein